MKSLIILLFSLVLVFCLFGCGGGDSDSPSTSEVVDDTNSQDGTDDTSDDSGTENSSGFVSTDLSGTWEYIGLISGDEPYETPGWFYGDWTIDDSGNMTTTTPVTDSLGSNTYIPTACSEISISSSGIITFDDDPGFDFRGVMNSGKDIIAATSTMCPGSSDDVCGYNLGIWIKAGETFQTSDLEGTWNMHGLTSGDSPDLTGWGYGPWDMDSSGNFTASVINSNDNPNSFSGTIIISDGGILSSDSMQSFHGVMNNYNDLIVCTLDDGGGGYTLGALLKEGADFSTTDLSGTWEYSVLISGDEPNETPGWVYGDWTIDDSGNMTTTTPVTDSLGSNTYIPTGDPSGIGISSSGVITLNNDQGAELHGVMNSEKDLIVSTSTMCPGSSDDVCGYNLGIWIKK